MALTNFGKVTVSGTGIGLVVVFVSAAAPAFAGNGTELFADNLTHSEQMIFASEGNSAPKFNLLLPPHLQESGSKIG
jgi:hypothetical protein